MKYIYSVVSEGYDDKLIGIKSFSDRNESLRYLIRITNIIYRWEWYYKRKYDFYHITFTKDHIRKRKQYQKEWYIIESRNLFIREKFGYRLHMVRSVLT